MNLNGKVFNPGEMRTQVTLQRRVVTNQVEAPVTLAVVWAKWENAHGAEAMQADVVQAGKTATVTIRYYAGFDETCSILKGSETYQVISMDDIRERHEYMEIKVRLAKAG